MKNKKKIITYLIIFLVVILLLAGATYTWFKWRSSNNTNVRITINNTSDLVITFDGGSNVTGTLEPTLTKEEGIVKNFSASTNGLDVPMNILLKLNSLPDALKDSTFKWELYKDNVYLNSGNFEGSEISTRTSNNTTDYNLVNNNIVGSTTVNYTLYLWIDGNVNNNLNMAGKSFDFDLYATVSSEELSIPYNMPASNFITALYNNSQKESVINNNITYRYSTSVNLMNDRLGGTTESLDGGNIRYYGANPNNYVWLGDTYSSVYLSKTAGDKKLWRVIGVFDGRIKLISNDPIITTADYLSWDTSSKYTNSVNSGGGINQWGESTYSDTGNVYEGADLMRLLNPGYESNQDLDKNGNTVTVNNSLYWNKGTGTVYTGSNNTTTSNVSFENIGLSSDEKNMIDSVTWYLGGIDSPSLYSDACYLAERQSTTLGKICSSSIVLCDDKVVRTATWNGMVGLIYPSDYGYSADFTLCNQTLYDYGNSSCSSNNWLYSSSSRKWTITPYAGSQTAQNIYVVNSGTVGLSTTSGGQPYYYAFPVIYLKPNVLISSGSGTISSPYVFELNT